jgi:hypothetical protein
VTDGSSSVFANSSYFTPAVPFGDYVEIQGSLITPFTYTITFSAPVVNPILHVGSLASAIVFPGISLTKASGEPEFVVAGSTVTGQSSLDRNGTVVLNGTFSTISFTVTALALFNNDRDGVAIQVGADVNPVPEPEPAMLALVGAGLLAMHPRCRLNRRRTAVEG